MNTLTPTHAPTIDQATLDRLVDGELDEATRASLLRALEREPDGWKRCALAFLEAQAWGAAVHTSLVASATTRAPARGAFLRPLLGIAAAVVVSFSAGFVLKSYSAQHPGAGGSMAAAVERPQAAPPARALGHVDPQRAPAPPVPEYFRLQMERQGYEVKGDRKVVAIGLDNGRKVTVPVDTLSYRFVGQRIH
jgi:hypothetical protein